MTRRKIMILCTISLLFIITTGPGTALAGDWVDETRVTTDPTEQDQAQMAAGPDNNLYLIWPKVVAKQTTLYMIMSENKGERWTLPEVILGPSSMDDFNMVADEAGIHISFMGYDSINAYWQLFYMGSTDCGATWSKPQQMGSWNNIYLNSIYSGDGDLLIYAKDGSGGHRVFFSGDGGVNWQENALLPGVNVDSLDFMLKDGVIHVAFGGIYNVPIAYSRSTDQGVTWTTPASVSVGAGPHSQVPTVAVDDGDNIHIAWEDDREGTFNVMYTRSLDDGATWSTDLRMNDTYYGARTQLLADEEGLHILWCQFHGVGWPGSWGSGDYGIIRSKFSNDQGATWSSELHLSQNESIPPLDYPDMGANYAQFCEYSLGLCAWWLDKRDGNIDVYMRNRLNFLAADSDTLSTATGGVVSFILDGDKGQTNRNYFVLGSISGTSPGLPLPYGGATLPLNWDLFTEMCIFLANGSNLKNFSGQLDAMGRGTAQLDTLGPVDPTLAGITLNFAFVCYHPLDYASNPVSVKLVP